MCMKRHFLCKNGHFLERFLRYINSMYSLIILIVSSSHTESVSIIFLGVFWGYMQPQCHLAI